MTPQQDIEGRRAQLGKLKVRLEDAGLLDKIGINRPVTLALYIGSEERASLALRWRRQTQEPFHRVEVLVIDPQHMAKPICGFVVNDLDALASELLQAVASLLTNELRCPA